MRSGFVSSRKAPASELGAFFFARLAWRGAAPCPGAGTARKPVPCASGLSVEYRPGRRRARSKYLSALKFSRKDLSVLNLLTRLFGSRNDRIVRGYEATVRKASASRPRSQALSDEALRRQDRRIPQAPRRRREAHRPRARSFRGRARSRAPHAEDAPLRRAAHRRTHAQRRPHRRDAHRRRQDADVDARRVSQRADRAKASTSSPSTNTWRRATRTGWARSTASSASPSA